MKKLYVATMTAIFAALPMSIFAKGLPFVGEKYFYNYPFHTETTVKIDRSGNISIKGCGNAGCRFDYRGKYKEIVPLGNGVYVKLMPSYIYFTNSNVRISRVVYSLIDKSSIEVSHKELSYSTTYGV